MGPVETSPRHLWNVGWNPGTLTAIAHNLARILYAVITRRVPYNEDEAFKQTPATQTRRLINLQKQAARLGLQLIPAAG